MEVPKRELEETLQNPWERTVSREFLLRRSLEVVGITGIEDKLQAGKGDLIDFLAQSSRDMDVGQKVHLHFRTYFGRDWDVHWDGVLRPMAICHQISSDLHQISSDVHQIFIRCSSDFHRLHQIAPDCIRFRQIPDVWECHFDGIRFHWVPADFPRSSISFRWISSDSRFRSWMEECGRRV